MRPEKSNQSYQIIETNSKFSGAIFYDTALESSKVQKLLSPSIVNSFEETQAKPISSRIDYNFFNYCSTCELKYPKQILRCKDCNQKVRTRPWHRSKIIDRKRI